MPFGFSGGRCAAAGARRALAAVDKARHLRYNTNHNPMMTVVGWTNNVSSADTDNTTGPLAMYMGTSKVEEGRPAGAAGSESWLTWEAK